MARQKTSEARIYTARLNPINPHEREAIQVIERWKQEGCNFKQLIVDRILRGEGYKPEMFDTETGEPVTAQKLEALLNSFADEIVRHSKNRTVVPQDNDEDEGEDSAFTRNFTRGYLRRMQQGTGDDDE